LNPLLYATPIPDTPPAALTPEQAAILKDTRDRTIALQAQIDELANAEDRLDVAWVSNLPRAELKGNAVVRTNPSRAGEALYRAPAGTLLAVAGKDGEWVSAIYRDPLTDELAQGWVYGRSVKML
jgi:hypothetical protein